VRYYWYMLLLPSEPNIGPTLHTLAHSDNLEAAASGTQVLVDNILLLDLGHFEKHTHFGAQPGMGFLAFGSVSLCCCPCQGMAATEEL